MTPVQFIDRVVWKVVAIAAGTVLAGCGYGLWFIVHLTHF
jgi:hypothetical protein